jgi:hypothetical protein
MPRTCYLHIGMPKTGSSSIQASLKTYEDERVTYARLGPENHSVPLCTIYAREPHRFYVHEAKALSQHDVEGLKAGYRVLLEQEFSGEKDLILSGEALFGHISPDDVRRLLADLRKHFDHVRIIAYVRPARPLLPSRLQQLIRMGQNHFALPLPNYRSHFAPWIEHAGAENVDFRRFDRAALSGGDVVEDFAALVGLDLSRVERRSRNESISLEAMAVLYCYNIFQGALLPRPVRVSARAQFSTKLVGFGTSKIGLAAELVDPILAAHSDDIDWMERIAGFSVSDPAAEVENPIRSEQHLIMIGRRAMPALREKLEKAKSVKEQGGLSGKVLTAARKFSARARNQS